MIEPSKDINSAVEREIASLADKLFPSIEYKVLTVKLEEFSKEPLGFQGVHKLLIIEACKRSDPESVESRRFFVKTTVPNCNEHQRNLFNREPTFFREVVTRLLSECDNGEPWAPTCYLAKENMLIFEDLKSQGFEVVSDEFDEKHLRWLVSCLARFHVASMLLEELEQRPISAIYPGVFYEKMFDNDGKLTWKWLTCGIEVIEEIAASLGFDPSHVAAAYQLCLQTIKPRDSELNVLCHSDLWRYNMMFNQRAETCRLVDFQLVAYKCYAVDLVQALHLNATKARRQQLERTLIQLYHAKVNQLVKSNDSYKGKLITLDEVFQAVEQKRICGLVSAVQILPIALLNKRFSAELFKDSDSLKAHMYVSRKSLILKAMRSDVLFKTRVHEVTTELMEYMNHIST